MKICFVTYSLSLGGAEQSLSVMANYWAKQGWSVTIIRLEQCDSEPHYPLDSRIRLLDLQTVSEATSGLDQVTSLFRTLRALRRTIRKEQAEAVISFLDWVNVVTILSAQGLGVPIVYSERVDPRYAPTKRFWKLLRPLVYRLGSRLVVLSTGCLEAFSGSVRRSARVIPNPIPPAECTTEAAPAQQQIVAMGRLVKQKGFDLLLEAFAKVNHAHPDWRLVIYGEGPERFSLEQRVRTLDLEACVSLPGLTKKPLESLRSASIFAMSSRFEGFGRVLAEAMTCGLPVVSFDCPSGPSEIFRAEQDGILVPPEDVDGFAAALSRLIDSKELRETMGRNAQERSRRFLPERVCAEWEELLEEVLQS